MGAYKDSQRGTWYASFYYTDWTGQRRHKTKRGFKTQREAKAWEREFLGKEAREADMPFGSLLDLYISDMEHRLKPTTVFQQKALIERWIRPDLKDIPVNKIEPVTVRNWQNKILSYRDDNGKPLSSTYISAIHTQLSTIMNYAVRNYRLSSNPCLVAGNVKKTAARKVDFWTHTEYDQFRKCEERKHYRTAFDTLFYTGIRCGELLALTPEDFTQDLMLNINKNYAVIEKKEYILTPKTDTSNRVISIPKFLYDEVTEFIASRSIGKGERIFQLSKSRITAAMERTAKKAGLRKIRLHDLRHSHVALLIDQGFTMKEIQERMGHKSIKTTMDIYGHLYKDHKSAVGDKLQELRQKLDEDA